MTTPNPHGATCYECDRVFDLTLEVEAAEWHYGHDCEPAEPVWVCDLPGCGVGCKDRAALARHQDLTAMHVVLAVRAAGLDIAHPDGPTEDRPTPWCCVDVIDVGGPGAEIVHNEYGHQRKETSMNCSSCDQPLIGSEVDHGTCGHCGRRYVDPIVGIPV